MGHPKQSGATGCYFYTLPKEEAYLDYFLNNERMSHGYISCKKAPLGITVVKTIVWEFPGFSVKTHLSKLLDCQKEVEEKGCLEDFGHRFYIVSRKGVFIDDIV